MSEAEAFRDLIRRVRGGHDEAAAEVVHGYEATIRLAVCVRLDQSDLRRRLDSTDVCQSVLANFFVRAASGPFELGTPGQLVKLLVTVARNRPLNHAKQQAGGPPRRRRHT
jgi:RNA polymerase sigma-70 factor (ECF subfamily)